MSGKLLEQARLDAIRFASSGGFEEDIVLKTKDGSISLAFKGLHTGHTASFDSDGNPTNSSSFHFTVPTQVLIDSNYPYLNSKTNKPDLNGHYATIDGSNFVVNETKPSKTLGLIVCILGKST